MRLLLLSLVLAACSSTPKGERPEGCNTPLGFIPEGQSRIGYLHPMEQNQTSCLQGTVTCNNGEASGAYIYPACVRAP